MRGKPDVAGRVFTLLGKEAIDVLAIAQGSSELNLSFVLASEDEDRAVQGIHENWSLDWVKDKSKIIVHGNSEASHN